MDYNKLKEALAPDFTVNKDLSFTVAKSSITETYRRQLKVIAESIDVNLNGMLDMLTTDQLKQAVKEHQHIGWSEPYTNGIMFMDGLTKEPDGRWYLSFEERMFQLHELDIQECLNLLATLENVLVS